MQLFIRPGSVCVQRRSPRPRPVMRNKHVHIMDGSIEYAATAQRATNGASGPSDISTVYR